MPPRALSYEGRRAQRICEESQTTQFRSVAEIADIEQNFKISTEIKSQNAPFQD